MHVCLSVCVRMYSFMRAFEHVWVHSHTCNSSNTHSRMWRVCVLCSLYWVVVVLWQCWVLLRRQWRLRRRRGRCWIDTDVCWPWQRCDTPNGFRSAPTHFLSLCLVLIVAWRFRPASTPPLCLLCHDGYQVSPRPKVTIFNINYNKNTLKLCKKKISDLTYPFSKIFFHSLNCVSFSSTYISLKKKMKYIVRLQKQWFILFFFFILATVWNLPAFYSISVLPFDPLPIPFPIYLPTHLSCGQ